MTDGQVSGLAVGLRATVRAVVSQADTAASMGSGDVPVLATPRLLALAEAATVAAVAPHLGAGQISVGTAARLEHRRPSPLGAELWVEAELTQVDGPRLVFMFIARGAVPAAGSGAGGGGGGGADAGGAGSGGDDDDGDGGGGGEVIGAGTVERVVLDRERFLARLTGPPSPA
jgi:fluoroacetyl-CoA thioesterase